MVLKFWATISPSKDPDVAVTLPVNSPSDAYTFPRNSPLVAVTLPLISTSLAYNLPFCKTRNGADVFWDLVAPAQNLTLVSAVPSPVAPALIVESLPAS